MKRWFLAAALLAAPAFAAELEGVTSADSLTVEGKALSLNGMGLRQKFIFKVYVASLYVEHPAKDTATLLKADEVRRVEMHMLRDLDRNTIVDAIKTGFEKNAGAGLPALQERLSKFIEKVTEVKKGATLIIQYVPGKGTKIEGGKESYVAEGKDFADALFSVWIGQYPVDDGLKKGMLGNK
jgi:predicted enzyme involved in methoxymalonyl-ACP biosynthesis